VGKIPNNKDDENNGAEREEDLAPEKVRRIDGKNIGVLPDEIDERLVVILRNNDLEIGPVVECPFEGVLGAFDEPNFLDMVTRLVAFEDLVKFVVGQFLVSAAHGGHGVVLAHQNDEDEPQDDPKDPIVVGLLGRVLGRHPLVGTPHSWAPEIAFVHIWSWHRFNIPINTNILKFLFGLSLYIIGELIQPISCHPGRT
jgi:hypothetical protein